MTVGRVGFMLPYWGDPGLLALTVESIRSQTDPDWTLTIVDDCDPDPTAGKAYAEHPDPRIRYVRNSTNLGLAANFERCRELAAEQLVAFVGCDDLVHPTFVARARSTLAAFPDAAILQMGVRVIDDSGVASLPLADRIKGMLRPHAQVARELSGEQLATSLLRGNWLYWPSLVFRRAWIADRSFRTDHPIILDLALVLDVVQEGGSLVLDPEVTFSYRRHSESLSSTAAVDGSRFRDDRRYFAEVADQLEGRGWPRAARAARRRWVSRLHALTLVPAALGAPERGPALRQVWTHVTR